MKRLKAGIIGLGVGEKHIEGYNSHPECEVTALCDFSKEKLAAAKIEYPNLKLVDDANKILCDPKIDVVSIASFDNYHYQHVMKAIENGKHVFVEKPLCLNIKEAKKIKSALKKSRLKMSSNLILRNCPRFKFLKKSIHEGEMGEIFYLDGDYNYGRLEKLTDGWRGDIGYYSVVLGGAVHIVDLFLWLTETKVIEVHSVGNNICTKNSKFRHDDLAVSLLKFKNGMIGKVSANFGCVFPHFHNLSVYGTKATFVNGKEFGTLYRSRDPRATPEKVYEAYPGTQKGDLIPSFIESILTGKRAKVTEEDVFNTMAVCLSIDESKKKSKPFRILNI